MGGRGAVAAAVALWAGMLLGPWAGVSGPCIGALALGLLAWRAPPRIATVLTLAVMVLVGAARAGAHHGAIHASRHGLTEAGALHRIEGVVSGPPRRASGMPEATIVIHAASPPLARGARMRVRFEPGVAIAWGDRVRAIAWLEAPLGRRNPGGRDTRAAATAAGIAGHGRARVAEIEPAPGLAGWPRATVERWRGAIERRLAEGLEPSAHALVLPLVVGDRSAMPVDLDASLRAAGLIHLLALSGLHVSWMAGVARGLVSCAGGGLVARACAGGLFALLYLGLAGPLGSLARAAATEALRAAASATQRALDPLQALAVSVIGLLAIAPGWSGDLGFQLSCAATAGLATIGARLAPDGRWSAVSGPIGMTVAAQWTTLGLLIHHTHAFSWIAPLSNLAAVPLAGLLLASSWIALIVEMALPGAGAAWFGACEALAAALTAVTTWAARVPSALVPCGAGAAPAWWSGVGAALAVWACAIPHEPAFRFSRARGRVLLAGVAASALAIALALTAPPLRPPPGRAWVVALDVGQGDAIALGFGDGWWLVDAGPSGPTHDAGEWVVAPFLRWAGVRRIETLVLTHGDRDHVGGVRAVRRAVAVPRVITPSGGDGRTGLAAGPRARRAARGDTLRHAPPVVVRWPPPATPHAGDVNATGLVIEVGEGGGRALLLGDVDAAVESRLAIEPRVALLHAGHHGSRSSSGAAFLDHARPRAAVISCGRRNPFGHPHPDVVARLVAAGARVHRTDLEGAVWFELGAGLDRVDWRRGTPGAVHGVSRAARAGPPAVRSPAAAPRRS